MHLAGLALVEGEECYQPQGAESHRPEERLGKEIVLVLDELRLGPSHEEDRVDRHPEESKVHDDVEVLQVEDLLGPPRTAECRQCSN